MRFYLSSRYSRRDELHGYREDLLREGHEVASSWLDKDERAHIPDCEGDDWEKELDGKQLFGWNCYCEIRRADVFLFFSDDDAASNSKEFHCVEFGIAYAAGKKVIVIGPRENVFHHLPGVDWCTTWADLVKGWFPDFEEEKASLST